eukprot:1157424-Pelagomonas_calceolata.AAC.4
MLTKELQVWDQLRRDVPIRSASACRNKESIFMQGRAAVFPPGTSSKEQEEQLQQQRLQYLKQQRQQQQEREEYEVLWRQPPPAASPCFSLHQIKVNSSSIAPSFLKCPPRNVELLWRSPSCRLVAALTWACAEWEGLSADKLLQDKKHLHLLESLLYVQDRLAALRQRHGQAVQDRLAALKQRHGQACSCAQGHLRSAHNSALLAGAGCPVLAALWQGLGGAS